jgi:proteasome lid subunit RPN8/RPN11
MSSASDELVFGEVQQVAVGQLQRPDEGAEFAVVPYGGPRDGDLPVFVDLDALTAMDQHAKSDTAVELGGVLLGGRYQDSRGRPFVVISHSLRAEHYRSTQASFKFTHETWSAIARQRQRLSPELQIVGWYHTHPGFGVFLSGMDQFICEHFFNHRLDVAYVVDPCRGERGMFQWVKGDELRLQRTGGFFVTTTRVRAAEVEGYVSELESSALVSDASVAPANDRPQYAIPPLHAVGALGALLVQFALLAMITWQVVASSDSAVGWWLVGAALAIATLVCGISWLPGRASPAAAKSA